MAHRDAPLLGVGELGIPRPDRVPQRRDHTHAREVGLERELESQLVVALAGAAVDDRLGADLLGDLGDGLRDDGARERRDERIAVLVEGVRLDRLRALVVGEGVLESTSMTSAAPAALPRVSEPSTSNSWPTSTITATTSSKP